MPENFVAIKITISKVAKSFGMKKIISDIVALNSLSHLAFELIFFIFLDFFLFGWEEIRFDASNDKGRVLMGRVSSFISYNNHNREKKSKENFLSISHFTRNLLLSHLIRINEKKNENLS